MMTERITRKFSHLRLPGKPGAARRLLLRGMAAVLCLLLAGCASSPAARDKALQERAQARWDALLAGDFAAAYAFNSPGYRSATSVTDFEISFRVRRLKYEAAKYDSHSCEEQACTVRIWVDYSIPRPAQGVPEWKGRNVIEERWILTDGTWWFAPPG
jgi:hypothetical protein